MNIIIYYSFLFIFYSFIGWVLESCCCTFYKKKVVLNRGFLIGPYCPIYGTGALLMILFLNDYKDDLFVLFMMSMVYASIVEYITSYIMEKVFKARWWDYSHYKYNIDGRICLKNSLLFGLCGIILLRHLHPFFEILLSKIPVFIFNIIALIIIVIFIIDVIVSFSIISRLKLKVADIKSDSTEEIDRLVKEALSKNMKLKRRIFRAYPKVKFTNDKSGKILNSVKLRFKNIDAEILAKKKEIKLIKSDIRNLKSKKSDKSIIKETKRKLKEVRRRKV